MEIIKERTGEFKIPIGYHFKDDKRDLIITDRKKLGRYKYYKYICNKCSYDCGEHYIKGEFKLEHWVDECSLIRGSSCTCCCQPSKATVTNINSIWNTDKWLTEIVGDEISKITTKSSTLKINPKCPNCGQMKNKLMSINTISTNKSIGCNHCSDGISTPNKIMNSILKQLDIEYEVEYSPEWIGKKRYDFFIPKYNTIIEIDGSFHKKDNIMSTQTKEMSKEIDIYKDLKAKENGLDIIRIDAFKPNIKYIRDSIINNIDFCRLFDINKINWDVCEQDSIRNMVVEVSRYWNNKLPYETSVDLAKVFNIHRTTVTLYLKKGNNLGLCNYDENEEHIKAVKKANSIASKNRLKEIIAYNRETVEIGRFESAIYISQHSLEIFGVELKANNIRQVARGDKQSYKGFTFKYVDTNKEEIA